MKSKGIILIVFILFTAAMSCRNKENAFQENEVFRYNQIGGLESLDPAFAKNLAIMWAVHLMYNTLVEVDSNLQIVPSIAKSYDISDDGLKYTFILRNDVYFQNHVGFENGRGRKMVASDVVYTFNRIIDPQTASPGAWVFNERVIEKDPFTAIDDTTLVIKLSQPFAPFLEILSMPYCSIVPFEIVEKYQKDFRSHPCGTGPFQLIKWDEGNTLIMHKNPLYWERDDQGGQLPYIKAVQISFNETRAMEFLLLKQNKLDFVNGIDGSMKDLILTKKGTLKPEMSQFLNLSKRPYLNTEYIGIMMDTTKYLQKNHPLQYQQIRQAINLAIDRQKIVTYFRNGVGIPAWQGFIPTKMPGMLHRPTRWHYNPKKAIEMIDEIKTKVALPEIIIATPEANADVCNFVAQQLQDVGLQTQVQVYQPGLLRQMMSQGQVQFFKAQWIADYPDPETYLAFFYSLLPAPPNYTRFNNKLFDKIYNQAISTKDPTDRYSKYLILDSIISEVAPVIPLFYDEMLHFTRKEVSGFVANPMNIIDIKRVKKNN